MPSRENCPEVVERAPYRGSEHPSHHQQEVGMSRTDVVASPRLQTADKAPMWERSSRASRRLLVLPIALLLAVALVAPTTALAASTGNQGLSGYNQTPKPSSGTSPSKEKSTPKKETAPAKTTTTPTTTTESA